MKQKPRNGWPLKMLLLTLLLGGCVHLRMDNSRRLQEREDFRAAATAAPEWVRDALKTINRLEFELERK